MNSPPPQRTGLWLALVLTLTAAVYTPTLFNDFTFDDPFYARSVHPSGDLNPMVADLHPPQDYFRVPMNTGVSYFGRGFRPVTVYSYALLSHLGRDGPAVSHQPPTDAAWPHHLCNLLLHLLATWLVFSLVARFTRPAPALLAALVFGVHALHAEAIAPIVGRAELLAFVFGAAATRVYLGVAAGPGRASSRLPIVAALLFVAFGSKESAVAWAAFTPLVGFLAARGGGDRATQSGVWRHALLAIGAVALPLAVFLSLRHAMLAEHIAPHGPFLIAHEANRLYYATFFERLPAAIMLLGYALYKTVLPLSLCSSYREAVFDLPTSFADPRVLSAGLLLAGLLAGGCAVWRRHRLLFLAAAAFFGFSFITSNIPFPIETIFAERLLYSPSLGLALAVAWLGTRLRPSHRIAAAAALAIWVAANAWLGFARSTEWRDNDTLFAADVAKQPRCIELHRNVAALRFHNFDKRGGEAHLRRAVELGPRFPDPLIKLATFLLGEGIALQRAKRHAPAAELFAEVEDLLDSAMASPFYVSALEGRNVHVLLSALREQQGRRADALAHLETALQCDPRNVIVRLQLMQELEQRGEHDRCRAILAAGERIWPDNPYFAVCRGRLAFAAHRHDDAVALLGRALPGLPDEIHVLEARRDYAAALAHMGRRDDSRAQIERCLALPRLPEDLRAAFEALHARLGAAAPGL